MNDEKKFNEDSLGGRLKGYEKKSELKIPYDEFVLVRIDGHKFSKFTKGFDKPFDKRLSAAFEKTTMDLVEEFGAVTGYTQSDEITLVFRPTFKEKIEKSLIDCDGFELAKPTIKNNQIFGGRTQKIASLLASFTAIKFNKYLEKELKDSFMESDEHWSNSFRRTSEEDEYYTKRAKLMSKIGKAWFDARAFGVPSDEEAFNTVMWRVRDAIKNSKAMFAQAYCSHESLLNKNSDEQINFCLLETGKDWYSIDDKLKYGILVKKEYFEKLVDTNVIRNKVIVKKEESVKRTRIVSWAEKLSTFDVEKVDLIIRKIK